jgi:hypothetical protein
MLEDLGRHLKMGETIMQCLCVPQINLFSYTNPDFPVVNHEWLTQVVLFFFYANFGLQSLLILKMLILTTAFGIVYFLAKQKSSWYWLTIFSLCCVIIFSSRFRVRPEMFSYLFIALFLLLLHYYDKTKQKILFLLPLIELFWVNMHIYFILGIIIYAAFCVEKIAEKKFSTFLLWIGLSLLVATLINPRFLDGALLPFTFLSQYGMSVEENMSVFDFGKYAPSFIYTLTMQVVLFEILVGLFILIIPIYFKKTSLGQTLNGLISGVLGLRFVRSLSLFGLLGLIPLSEKFTLLEKALYRITDRYFVNVIKAIILIATIFLSSVYLQGLNQYHVLHFGYQPYAENATNFINNNQLKGPIFNNYHIGNYLIYGLYPGEKIFIDARPEMYPTSFLKSYERMLIDQEYFKKQVEFYKINLIVFGVQLEDPQTIRPFMLRQIQSKEWIPVFADGNVTILIKNDPKNKEIITRHALPMQ